MAYPNTPICASRLARKMEAISNFEVEEVQSQVLAEPRLAEVLWLLQWISWPANYPGGLRKFALDLIEVSPDLIGTATMQAHPEGEFDDETLYAIHEEIPCGIPWEEGRTQIAPHDDIFGSSHYATRVPRAELEAHCRAKAEENLAYYLRSLCEIPAVGFHRAAGRCYGGDSAPWYFVNVAEALLRWMDDWKSHRAAQIAETTISREIFKWLGKVRATRRSIVISGNSRFGKTESVRAWCDMHAGRARFVDTPAGNTETELLRAVAVALGVTVEGRDTASRLRIDLEAVLRHSGLFLVFEEAQALFPSKFTKNTAPARLNWVRRSVMDGGTPCVFVCTPQSMGDARRRYVKATGFAVEQFDGRIMKTVALPEEVTREDLLAIAAIHLPGIGDDYLLHVATKAAATRRNYVSDVSAIGALAFSNAEDAGRTLPNLADIIAAIADVLPAADSIRKAPGAEPVQAAGSRIAAPPRAIIPDASQPARPILFDSETPEELTVTAGD